MLNNRFRTVLAVALLGAAFFETEVIEGFNYVKDQISSVEVVGNPWAEPSEQVKEMVKGVGDMVAGENSNQDRLHIRDFFFHLSNIVKDEPGFIKTTGDFREFNSMSGQINFSGMSLKDKYDGLGERIDEILATAVGLENISMDAATRQKLSEVLYGIAWEFSK